MTEESTDTITLPDITGALAYLSYKGIKINLKTQSGGRVVGDVPATPEVYRLLAEFQSNPLIPINDFLSYQRRIRGNMLDIRDGARRHNHNGRQNYGKQETPEYNL